MQETKIFRQGPPHLMILFDGGIFKQEILFRCENFLCYARNEKISPRPPLKINFKSCFMQETKTFRQGPPT